MATKYKFIVAIVLLYAIVVSAVAGAVLVLGQERIVYLTSLRVIPDISSSSGQDILNDSDIYPIIHDNLLVFSVRINKISNSLNEAIQKSNLELPQVEFYNSDLSYKAPGRSWVMVSNDLILIVLYRDVVSVLNSSEIQAVAVHELCHVTLGHTNSDQPQERDIEKEKSADRCTIGFGIDSGTLASAINKLSPEGEEKSERISALTV